MFFLSLSSLHLLLTRYGITGEELYGDVSEGILAYLMRAYTLVSPSLHHVGTCMLGCALRKSVAYTCRDNAIRIAT